MERFEKGEEEQEKKINDMRKSFKAISDVVTMECSKH
jgi:hypothetical protein